MLTRGSSMPDHFENMIRGCLYADRLHYTSSVVPEVFNRSRREAPLSSARMTTPALLGGLETGPTKAMAGSTAVVATARRPKHFILTGTCDGSSEHAG